MCANEQEYFPISCSVDAAAIAPLWECGTYGHLPVSLAQASIASTWLPCFPSQSLILVSFSVHSSCPTLSSTLFPTASAYANLQWEQQPRQDGSHPPQDYPQRDQPPVAGYIPQPNYMEEDHDLIKPKKLLNPVKASKSHQDLQRELLMSQKRYNSHPTVTYKILDGTADWGYYPAI